MFTYVLICLVAFCASLLTLFSGFGLGTILLPAFALFFPLDISIALTAIVHFLNNLFKLVLLGKYAHKETLVRFGVPSVIAAFVGAWSLSWLMGQAPLGSVTMFGHSFALLPFKMVIGILIVFFALLDLIPRWSKLAFSPSFMSVGGAISGFFGGLSGHQGILRTAFLVKSGLDKEAFIATGVVVACMVDVTRLSVYIPHLNTLSLHTGLLVAATLSAFGGAFLGNRLLKKVTLLYIQRWVGAMLIFFGALMALGII